MTEETEKSTPKRIFFFLFYFFRIGTEVDKGAGQDFVSHWLSSTYARGAASAPQVVGIQALT